MGHFLVVEAQRGETEAVSRFFTTPPSTISGIGIPTRLSNGTLFPDMSISFSSNLIPLPMYYENSDADCVLMTLTDKTLLR
jgi:hypothetical protein